MPRLEHRRLNFQTSQVINLPYKSKILSVISDNGNAILVFSHGNMVKTTEDRKIAMVRSGQDTLTHDQAYLGSCVSENGAVHHVLEVL